MVAIVVATYIHRLVQEALTNVAKHAHASSVRVAVMASDASMLDRLGILKSSTSTRGRPS